MMPDVTSSRTRVMADVFMRCRYHIEV
jgi:hypothetical protein